MPTVVLVLPEITQSHLQNSLLPSSWDGICAHLSAEPSGSSTTCRHLHPVPSCSPDGPESPFSPGSPAEPLSPLGPTGPAGPGIPALPTAPGEPVVAEEMGINLTLVPGGASCLYSQAPCMPSRFYRVWTYISILLGPMVVQEMGVHISFLQVRKLAGHSWLWIQAKTYLTWLVHSIYSRQFVSIFNRQSISIYC